MIFFICVLEILFPSWNGHSSFLSLSFYSLIPYFSYQLSTRGTLGSVFAAVIPRSSFFLL